MLRGTFVRGSLQSTCGERKLVAAVIGKALEDARKGNEEAATWFDEVGITWCSYFLGIDEAAVAAWREADLSVRPPEDLDRERAMARERSRRRREKNRAARVAGNGGKQQ